MDFQNQFKEKGLTAVKEKYRGQMWGVGGRTPI